MKVKQENSTKAGPDTWKMFNRISGTYDSINHVLSLGQDILWRHKLSSCLPEGKDKVVLDLATGTADVLLDLFKSNAGISKAYGIDRSDNMLDIGREKVKKRGLSDRIVLENADAGQLPYEDDKFDAVTIAFGIRNMEDPGGVLEEMFRVIRTGGRVLILEFSLPENFLVRKANLFYLRNIVPFAGGLLSGDMSAYRYLNRTIENFPYGKDFCRMMEEAGFSDIRTVRLAFGSATIYLGDKN